jgi:hypothetical protein
MVHSEGMQIQTALFFETPEEIFARVFREAKPALAAPEVELRYRKYANANSSIRWQDGRLRVMMADVLQGAPAPVLEALARILVAKMFRRPVPVQAQKQFRLFLNRKEMRRQLHLVREIRGRKRITGPEGGHFQLEEIFDALNAGYFNGLLARPQLGWSLRAARTLLGHYDPSHNAIILSRRLDEPDVPPVLVEYVMFHEMLHLRHPVEHRGARRRVHTREFREAEKAYPRLKEAREAMKKL